MDISLSQIKSKVNELAKSIGAPADTLPTFGASEHSGRPHVEVDGTGYHYVIAERGQELEHHITFEIDELLYHIFQAVTFELACRYELKHRVTGQDIRRILFQYQEELLSKLDPAWGERRKREHAEILQSHPFNDR